MVRVRVRVIRMLRVTLRVRLRLEGGGLMYNHNRQESQKALA